MSQQKCQFFPLLIIYHLHWHQWSKVMAFSCSSLNSLLKMSNSFIRGYNWAEICCKLRWQFKIISNILMNIATYRSLWVLMGFVKTGIVWWTPKGTGTRQSLPDHIWFHPLKSIKTHQDPQLPSIIHDVQLSTNSFKCSNCLSCFHSLHHISARL